MTLEALTTEDDYPWAVYAYGHVEINDDLRAALTAYAESDWSYMDWLPPVSEWLADLPIEHLYMHNEYELGDETHMASEDAPWFFCDKDDEGAIAITGIKAINHVF